VDGRKYGGCSILIFIKAPVAGFVKTRLTPRTDSSQAAELYKAMAQDTFRVASQVPDARVVVAYQPHPEFMEPHWLFDVSKREWFIQGGSDLGERLERASADVLEKAEGLPYHRFRSSGLNTHPAGESVRFTAYRSGRLGPAEDGGYYLMGFREPQTRLVSRHRLVAAGVLEQTIGKLKSLRLDYKLLPRRMDIDTAGGSPPFCVPIRL